MSNKDRFQRGWKRIKPSTKLRIGAQVLAFSTLYCTWGAFMKWPILLALPAVAFVLALLLLPQYPAIVGAIGLVVGGIYVAVFLFSILGRRDNDNK
jgi:hypothetical protein